jgi:ankyrin repeat protein
MFSGKKDQELINYSEEFVAAAAEGNIKVVKAFLKTTTLQKTKLNLDTQRSSDGATALHMAAQEGHVVIVLLLLEAGASPNIKTHYNDAPLHLAAENGHSDIVKLLLDEKADPNIKNQAGLTPLDEAVYKNHLKISSLLDGFEQNMHSCIVQRMQALGFKINFVCYGFSNVATIFALSGENLLNYFYNTLFFLKNIKVKDLMSMHKNHGLIENQYLDILSLFNGIELAHRGENYPHLYSKHNLILLDKKDFKKNQPQIGELLITQDKDDSLKYKLKNFEGIHKKNSISQKELKTEIQSQYPIFSHSLKTKNLPKLTTFLPHFFNITSKKGDLISERRFSAQYDNPKWVTDYIQPTILEKKGGMLQVASFTGTYKKDELPIYFNRFRIRLKEKEINEPIALSLHYSNHAISIIYNPNDEWRIFEINNMPSKSSELKEYIFPGETIISEKISPNLFSNEGNSIFQTCVLTIKEAEEKMKPAINAWLEDLKSIHKITTEKATILDYQGASWLWVAAKAEEFETMKTLILNGANVNCKNEKGNSLLHATILHDNIEAVRILLNDPKIKINEVNQESTTPIYAAALLGRTDIVRVLLEAKLEEKINPNLSTDEGATPLMIAIQKGYNNIVNLLLKIENINLDPAENGLSPLFLAAQAGNLEIMQMLLKRSKEIDPNPLVAKPGVNALHMAISKGHIEIVNLLLTAKFKTKIDINQKGEKNITPLYVAAQAGQAAIARILLNLGADANILLVEEYTCVYVAAQKGHADVIKELAEKEVDLNITDKKGITPLMAAILAGHTHVVKVLLETGKVDIKAIANDGCTALDIAKKMKRTDIEKLLFLYIRLNINYTREVFTI